VDDEKHLARDFYGFLRNFLGVFDHLADRDLYIFGESYAGEDMWIGLGGAAFSSRVHPCGLGEHCV
jgi:carboxypeptidase C (cathepsin A)